MGKLLDEIEFDVEYGAEPNKEFNNADGWTCTFYYKGLEMEVPFYLGSGHKGREPEMVEVLDCLFMDGRASEEDFEEWCSEYGYNNDSIKDLKTYELCVKIGIELKTLFGEDYEQIQDEVQELVE